MIYSLEVLEKLHGFYSSAWTNLIAYTTGLVAFIAIIIPIFFQIYQNRKLKLDERELEKKLTNKIDNKFEEIEEVITMQVKLEIEKKHKNLQKEIYQTVAMSKYSHANIRYKEEENKSHALDSYIEAAKYYLNGDNEQGLRRALKRIKEDCLPKIDQQALITYPSLLSSLEELLELLKLNNTNGRYSDYIDSISTLKITAFSSNN